MSAASQAWFWKLGAAACLALMTGGCNAERSERPPGPDDVYCEVISAYAAPKDCNDFIEQAKRTMGGKAAFNAPNPMKRGDTFSVWLAVAADPDGPRPTLSLSPPEPPEPSAQPSEEASASASGTADSGAPSEPAPEPAPLPPPSAPEARAPAPEDVVAAMPGHVETFPVFVADRMAVDLMGDDSFKIEAKSPRTQRINLKPPYASTIWRWDVKALHGGDHVMVINAVVQVMDREGQFHDVVASAQPYRFHVQVGVVGWIQDFLEQTPFWIKLLTGVVLALVSLVAAVKSLRDGVLSLFGRGPVPPPAHGAAAENPGISAPVSSDDETDGRA